MIELECLEARAAQKPKKDTCRGTRGEPWDILISFKFQSIYMGISMQAPQNGTGTLIACEGRSTSSQRIPKSNLRYEASADDVFADKEPKKHCVCGTL